MRNWQVNSCTQVTWIYFWEINVMVEFHSGSLYTLRIGFPKSTICEREMPKECTQQLSAKWKDSKTAINFPETAPIDKVQNITT